jgi:hypothetical protein
MLAVALADKLGRIFMTTNSVNTSFKAVTNTANTSGGADIAQLRAKLKNLFVKVKEISLRKDLDEESKKQILQSYQDQIQLIMQQIEALQSKTSKQQPSSPDLQVTETEKPAPSKSTPSKQGMQAGIDTFA